MSRSREWPIAAAVERHSHGFPKPNPLDPSRPGGKKKGKYKTLPEIKPVKHRFIQQKPRKTR